MTDLASRLAEVDARIADAAHSAGRDPSDLTRIVVTKFHPAQLVTDLAALGVRDVGENRQQELTAKREALRQAQVPGLDGVRWHFIGQLQTKKARAVRAASDVVHSVDRDRLADALHAADPGGDPLDVFVQVNLTEDPARGGAAPDEVERLAEHIAQACPSLRVRGVMAVAPLTDAPAAAFERLARSAAAVRRVVPDATWMSAGMSGDFAEAIAAGATHLRIGTAITGPRPEHG
ncbi:MAG: YggS family pyridoxal phosphate enzyme [Microbacterium sp. SCN 70-200]|uniref:YggS family pyridoxal phosphate-dependent enzyme n=1 Tax=unclassified Microbacterium TaxID=2609290 RepID=UPI00086D005D|nr:MULTISPECIES: YggS family pyridoxal phosphate-dependent enzyme [unclassified Microbacterium]MBN9215940.1 YggS family pyridoxal phosphate-dependent enzyme [Microbacterium sp.]ODT41863.1 MAG: YggS family pyridoxal phosphate enzyme [Microbacterium sp. SCN 70-200]OJV84552.1 MAG: YggS family pyridoxal phosphate enzyme [Microbacterium sp. 70-16]